MPPRSTGTGLEGLDTVIVSAGVQDTREGESFDSTAPHTMLEKSFGYLRTAPKWERTVLVGGLLSLFSFLIVPAFALMGYLLRVLRVTMRGDGERPPVFDDWGELTVDGLKGYLVVLAYGLLPGVAFLVTAAVGVAGFSSGSDVGAVTGSLAVLSGGLVTLVLTVAVAYVLPAAILNYAETDSLSDGFAFGEISTILTHRTYATAFVYVLGVFLGFALVAGVLNAVPVLGAIASAFLGFYVAVVAASIYGTAYAEMNAIEIVDGTDADERAVV